MSKLKLTQAEIDKLVVVDRVEVVSRVCGVGINDVFFQVKIGTKSIWQYRLWQNMLNRSYCPKYKLRFPTYIGITCCDEWLSFANFLEWVNKEVDYKGKPEGMCLDKDITIKGNKMYSPEACSFVPRDVNMLLNDRGAARGEWPVGVCFHNTNGRFTTALRCGSGKKCLGYFDTPEEAFAVYKIAKEAQIKAAANQYKDVLKPAAYKSLMNWEISIAD